MILCLRVDNIKGLNSVISKLQNDVDILLKDSTVFLFIDDYANRITKKQVMKVISKSYNRDDFFLREINFSNINDYDVDIRKWIEDRVRNSEIEDIEKKNQQELVDFKLMLDRLERYLEEEAKVE